MNYIIHLKKLANLSNKKSVLKLRKTRNVTSEELFSVAIRAFLSALLKCPYITKFLMFPDPRKSRRSGKIKWNSKATSNINLFRYFEHNPNSVIQTKVGWKV